MKPDLTKQNEDVEAIRIWMAKEPHLPQDFEDLLVRKFLHSCYWSLERTKQCIDKFCTTRSHMDEVYISRDPNSPRLRTGLSISNVGVYRTPDNNEILIHQVNDPGLEKFVFYDLLKAFTLLGDYYLNEIDNLPDGHMIILDMKDYSLKVIPKVNIIFLRDFFIFLLEATPVRLKQIHAINCPSYVDKLYALVKPVLPAHIIDLITFHSTHEGIYDFIDRKCLPTDYGGDSKSLKKLNDEWLVNVEKRRDYYCNDNLWKADLKKRPKGSVDINIMNGSFRTLDID